MSYTVYANYGFTGETVLEKFEDLSDAIRWAKDYTEEDMGGWDRIEVSSFKEDGEYVVHWCVDAEDYEHDGQPDEMQEWYDFDPDC